MNLSDQRHYNLQDPCPGAELEEIFPISLRARVLIIRSDSSLLNSYFTQIFGTVSILDGLDYHYKSFIKFLDEEESIQGRLIDVAQHEAIAWLNRVGQIYYFLNSELIKNKIGKIHHPTIDSVIPFRMKISAHRSVDAPKSSEDTDVLMERQARAISLLGGNLWVPRRRYNGVMLDLTRSNYTLAFQAPFPDGSNRNLVIEEIHVDLVSEAYGVLEKLLQLS